MVVTIRRLPPRLPPAARARLSEDSVDGVIDDAHAELVEGGSGVRSEEAHLYRVQRNHALQTNRSTRRLSVAQLHRTFSERPLHGALNRRPPGGERKDLRDALLPRRIARSEVRTPRHGIAMHLALDLRDL